MYILCSFLLYCEIYIVISLRFANILHQLHANNKDVDIQKENSCLLSVV